METCPEFIPGWAKCLEGKVLVPPLQPLPWRSDEDLVPVQELTHFSGEHLAAGLKTL
jgi:hypothetical protein